MIDWNSVEKDGLPEISGTYLTCSNERSVMALDYSAKHHLWNCSDLFDAEEAVAFSVYDVTHWAEINLPES